MYRDHPGAMIDLGTDPIARRWFLLIAGFYFFPATNGSPWLSYAGGE